MTGPATRWCLLAATLLPALTLLGCGGGSTGGGGPVTPLTVTTTLGSSTVPLTVIDLEPKRSSGAGEVITSLGPCKLTAIFVVALFPAMSVACMEITNDPWVTCREQAKLPLEIVAGVLLQETVARPET